MLLKPLILESIFEMSTSKSPIQTLNFLPKLWRVHVDGTPANFMIIMKKKGTNKVSVSKSQKKGLFTSKPSSLFYNMQLQTISAYTHQDTHNQKRKQENSLSGLPSFFLICP